MVAPSSSPVPTAGHLFVVEHDAVLRSMLCDYLEKQGWFVNSMGSAEELVGRIGRVRPDVVVLGTVQPHASALAVCRQLRAGDSRLPIILLVEQGDPASCVQGLQAGADECFAKPVPARQLSACARALLRRSGDSAPAEPLAAEAACCRIGQFTFVPGTRSVHGDGRVRALNDIEYRVMLELVQRPGVPVARERMLARPGSGQPGVRLRAVDTAVMRLRRMLEPDPSEPRYLQTVHGRGYMFVPPASRLQAGQPEGQSS